MIDLREILSPAHPANRGRLAQVDVRITTLSALSMVLAIVISTRITLPLSIAALCLLSALIARVPLRLMLRRLFAPLGFAGMLCLLRAFMTAGAPLLSLQLGALHLTASREGVIDGALLGSRVLACAFVPVLLSALTPPHRIFAVLRWAGMPRGWISIAVLMFRYIFLLFEQAASVVWAQKVRLGYDGLRRSVSSMGSLAGIVTLRSLDQADRTHQAMLARAYRGILPTTSLPPLRRGQLAALAVCFGSVLIAWVAAERWLP